MLLQASGHALISGSLSVYSVYPKTSLVDPCKFIRASFILSIGLVAADVAGSSGGVSTPGTRRRVDSSVCEGNVVPGVSMRGGLPGYGRGTTGVLRGYCGFGGPLSLWEILRLDLTT